MIESPEPIVVDTLRKIRASLQCMPIPADTAGMIVLVDERLEPILVDWTHAQLVCARAGELLPPQITQKVQDHLSDGAVPILAIFDGWMTVYHGRNTPTTPGGTA